MELETLWKDYGLDKLQTGLDTLFPRQDISFYEMAQRLIGGDIEGVFLDLFYGTVGGIGQRVIGLKNVFIWLVILGIVSALLSHFTQVFDRHQVADLSFYMMYLLMSTILVKCFLEAFGIARGALDEIVLFSRLLVPAFLLTVGLSSGSLAAASYHQLFVWILAGMEKILFAAILPATSALCMLAVINGIWKGSRLKLFISFVKKGSEYILKACIWFVTGFGILKSLLTPVIHSVESGVFKKAMDIVPGLGDAANGVAGLAFGSVIVIKNSVGLGLLILLLVLCAVPVIQLTAIGIMLKLSAAIMGIVTDGRITCCADEMADIVFLLLKTLAAAILLLFVSIALIAVFTNGGYAI